MSLLERLTGTTPEKQEQKGDRLLAAKRWGEAKLAYESALEKLTRRQHQETDRYRRLQAKIDKAGNALAREHRQSADDLLEGGFQDEARELLALAVEVSADHQLKLALEHQIHALDASRLPQTASDRPILQPTPNDYPAAALPEESDGEYFLALCHTLPDPIRKAYQNYGDPFRRGYIALNRGDFKAAARHLGKAHRDNPQSDSHIPLELATAYLNLNRREEAHDLLTVYLQHHPDVLPAYQLLCEIYWDQAEFMQAFDLLDRLPPDLSTSLAAAILRGETFERAGEREAARAHYRHFLEIYGWETRIAHNLARICRDLGQTDDAHQLYRQLMASCGGCGPGIAPQIRHEYAELCFEAGQHDTRLLELYLTLVRENANEAALYYTRVADIYANQGHANEARRFRDFARQLGAATNGRAPEQAAP